MRKQLRLLIQKNMEALECSDGTFADIYRIIFSMKDLLLWESFDGFRTTSQTYGEMEQTVTKMAEGLYAAIGDTHQYVGLEMENCPQWIAAFWAILRSGNKPYLINCRHPQSLTEGILRSLHITTVVGRGGTKLPVTFIDADSLQGTGILPDVFEDEIALSTSATSLNEVVCFYTGRQVTRQILNTRQILADCPRIAQHVDGHIKQLAFLPFYHVFGLFAVYFWFTFFGRSFVFLKDYAPDTLLKTCRRHRVTHIFAVPLFWHTVEEELEKQLQQEGEKTRRRLQRAMTFCESLQNLCPGAGTRLTRLIMRPVTGRLFGSSVRFCISGGSYLRDSALHLFNAIGYPLYNGYGMSEAGITSVELGDRPRERNRNAIGRPFTSVEYAVSPRGTLLIRGESLCCRRQINGETMDTPEWFDTQDVAEEKDGVYYIRGRMGDRVISPNGENINPDVVEQQFCLRDAVAFSVLGLPKEEGEELSLVVQVHPYLPADRLQALKKEMMAQNDSLPMAFRVCRFFFTADAIAPPTAIKVGRAYLRRGIESGSIRLTGAEEAGTFSTAVSDSPLRERVRQLVAEALHRPPEEIGDDAHILLELGASSLTYFELVNRLAEEFGLTEYSDEQAYCYTVAEISDYIERHLL